MTQANETGLRRLENDTVGILIAGETNIQDRDDPVSAFAGVRDALKDADIRFCHLEGPLCEPSADPENPDIPHKLTWRHSDPRMVNALLDAGIDAVSCASNVTYPASAALRSDTEDAASRDPTAAVEEEEEAAAAKSESERACSEAADPPNASTLTPTCTMTISETASRNRTDGPPSSPPPLAPPG